MTTIRNAFDKLPRFEQDAVLEHLNKAMLWRGWDEHKRNHASEEVAEIVEIFSRNGMDFEEYT